MKHVLLLNDMPGYGRIALGAMNPVLAALGHRVYSLPTALVSNVLDYGKFEILDTSSYLEKSIQVWDELGFRFDCICVGFLLGDSQVQLIEKIIGERRRQNPDVKVVVDPIMADEGHLYNGIDSSRISAMRAMCKAADVIVPNVTEACFLADKPYAETISRNTAEELLSGLSDGGHRSVVMTSVHLNDGTYAIAGYDRENRCAFEVPYEYLPIRIPGSGDFFSACLTGRLLEGASLEKACIDANAVIHDMIDRYGSSVERYHGIPIEQYLPHLLNLWRA